MQDDGKIKEALLWIASIFVSKKIGFRVSGGLAAMIYGSKRELCDIDIDICKSNFADIFNDIKTNIVFNGQYVDENWNCYLATLNYNGQEIDICGADKAKIKASNDKDWKSLPFDLNKINIADYMGLKIPVIDEKSLIDYKKILNREVDKIDVENILKKDIFN